MSTTKTTPPAQSKHPEREAFADRDDGALSVELVGLRRELDAHRSGKRATRERAHRMLDERVKRAEAHLQAQVRGVRFAASQPGGDMLGLDFTADALAFTRPEIVAAMHAAIDSETLPGEVDPNWSDLTDGEYQAERRRLSAAIAQREVELDGREMRRNVIARQLEHARRLAALAEEVKAA